MGNKKVGFCFITFCFSFVFYHASLSASEDTINFMWINREPDPQGKYIFPEIRKKQNGAWDLRVLDWIFAWLNANPDSNFNFWYDNNTVNSEQVENTKRDIEAFRATNLNMKGEFLLKKINDLSVLKQPDIEELLPQMSMYTRIDLYKIAIALDLLTKCQQKCRFMFVDIDKGLKSSRQKLYTPKLRSVNLNAADIYNTADAQNIENDKILLNGQEGTYGKNIDTNFFVIKNNKASIDELKAALTNDLIESESKNIINLKSDLKNEVENEELDSKFLELSRAYNIFSEDVELLKKYQHTTDVVEKQKLCHSIFDKYSKLWTRSRLQQSVTDETNTVKKYLHALKPDTIDMHGSKSNDVEELFEWIYDALKDPINACK